MLKLTSILLFPVDSHIHEFFLPLSELFWCHEFVSYQSQVTWKCTTWHFLCVVMTFSYYVMFIYNVFIFKRKACRIFIVSNASKKPVADLREGPERLSLPSWFWVEKKRNDRGEESQQGVNQNHPSPSPLAQSLDSPLKTAPICCPDHILPSADKQRPY